MEFTGIILSIMLAYYLRNRKLDKVLKLLFLYFILSEIFKQFMLFKTNDSYDFWYFPFQLCSQPLYLIPLYFLIKKDCILNFLSDFCLLGGIFVFFDTSGMHYDSSILTLNSYIWHYLLIFLGLFLKFNIENNDFRYEVFIYVLCVVCATVINLLFKDANMFYISPYHNMNQLVFKNISAYLGQNLTRIFYCLIQITGAYFINKLCKYFHINVK